MKTMGVRELKARISEVLREVQRGETIEVTSHGHVVARIMPVHSNEGNKQDVDSPHYTIRDLETLRAEISALWPEELSVEEVLTEMRR